MTTLTDARQKVTAWTYNDLGQMLTKTYPGTPVEKDEYTYDSVQRLHTHTRPSQKKATYGYDLRDRVTSVTWEFNGGSAAYPGGGENQSFTYFADGRPDSQSNGLTNVSFAYRPDGDPLSVTQSHSGGSWTVGYDHDDAGRLTDLTYPATTAGIEEVAYNYNLRGQLSGVYNPSTTSALATYTRRLDGLSSRIDYDNGSHTKSSYNQGKRNTSKVHHKTNGSWMDANLYGYDNRSRRIWQQWSGATGDRYEYDNAGQITAVDHGVSSPSTATGPITKDHDYTYDLMGNRTAFNVTTAGASSTVPARSTTYTPNDKNQYAAIGAAGSPPDGTPVHDLDGNLTDDDNRTYIWDAWNRLREVKDKTTGNLIATYTYDALGRRVSKVTTANAVQGAETVLFVYDGWNVIQEWSSLTVNLAYLVWGEDLSQNQSAKSAQNQSAKSEDTPFMRKVLAFGGWLVLVFFYGEEEVVGSLAESWAKAYDLSFDQPGCGSPVRFGG